MFLLALKDAWQHAQTRQRIWALAIPMILSNLTVPLVTLVDTAVVGHLPHDYQLGAVAVGGMIFTTMAWVFGFLRMGATGFAAQAAGKQDNAQLTQIFYQGLLLAGIIALLIILLAKPVFWLALANMQTSTELQAHAYAYFTTRLWGVPAILGSFALTGWLIGIQNAKAALLMSLASNLINIVLDVLFVFVLDWGVQGAARASAIAEWAGFLVGLSIAWKVLIRSEDLVKRLKKWANWQPLLGVNRDILVRSLLLQAVFLVITIQGGRLGDTTVSANALLLNGLMICSFALDGLAHALESLTGHALGANNKLALRRALLLTSSYALLASFVFMLFFLVFGAQFILLQTDIQSVFLAAQPYLPYLAVLPLVAVWSYILDGLFIGATKAKEMRNAMLLAVLVSLPVGYILQPLGNHGLWITFLLFMALRAGFLLIPARHISRWFKPV